MNKDVHSASRPDVSCSGCGACGVAGHGVQAFMQMFVSQSEIMMFWFHKHSSSDIILEGMGIFMFSQISFAVT